MLAGAVLIMVHRTGWTPSRDRFERPDAATRSRSLDPAGEDPAAVWKAMDAGLDPTADPADEPRDD